MDALFRRLNKQRSTLKPRHALPRVQWVKSASSGWPEAQKKATRLHLKTVRVSASTLKGTYIGETEKNLARLLAHADASTLLFFDEADALFGKRSRVRDAHNRYANQEVSHLLARLAEFPGWIVLASNH